MRLPYLFLAVFCLTLAAGGCGGGGVTPPVNNPPTVSPPPATPLTTRVSGTIQWAARSRVFTPPASALSAVITVRAAGTSGQDIVLRVNRDATPAAYSQAYTFSEEARVGGPYEIVVQFFAEPEGAGATVARATVTASIANDGILPTVGLEGTVALVEMNGGQSMLVGEVKSVTFTVKNGQGEVIAVSPGSEFLTVISGGERLRIENGRVVGVMPGNAEITVTVDNKISAPVPVSVTSNAVVSVSPPEAKLSIGASRRFTSSVSETSNQAVTWHIQEGAAGGSVSAEGDYTAPSTAGVYHLVATSVYDPNKSATVAVTVESGNVSVGVDFPASGDVEVIVD